MNQPKPLVTKISILVTLGIIIWTATNVGLAEAAKELVIYKFQNQTDSKSWQSGSQNMTFTIEPMSTPPGDAKLKAVYNPGDFHRFSIPKPPTDWSPYAAFLFEVWTQSDAETAVIISQKNKGNGFSSSYHLTPGRNVIQISLAEMQKSIDVTQIFSVEFRMGKTTTGVTLYYDNFRLGALEKEVVDFIPYSERQDKQPTLDVRTPHFKFGRNLSQGPIRAFALAGVVQGRDVAELMQRLDTQVSVVSWDSSSEANAWGFGDFYNTRGSAKGESGDIRLLQRYFASSIQGPEKFDVMLMTTPNGWNAFPQGARDRILSRVENDGAGLILIMPFPGVGQSEWTDELRKVCALVDLPWYSRKQLKTRQEGVSVGKPWRAVGSHPIMTGVPLNALPYRSMRVMKCKPAEGAEVLIETTDGFPVMAVKQLGKGRIVTFAFYSGCLTPEIKADEAERLTSYSHRYWEIWYDLLARSTYWASGRTFERNGSAIPLVAQGDDDDLYLKAQQWKDAQGKVTDWQIEFTPPVLKLVKLNAPEMIDQGKDIAISFTLPKEFPQATWTLTASEPATTGERIMETINLDLAGANAPLKDQLCSVTIPGGRFTKTAAYFQLTASQSNRTVAVGRTAVVFTPNEIWDDFEINCWGGSCGLPFLRDTVERNLERQLGITCQQAESVAGMRDALVNGFRNHLYANIKGLGIDNIPTLKKSYEQTKDRKFLVRTPSLADPEELAKRHQEVANRFSQMDTFKPLSVIISDETSLTKWTTAFDFDFHPANIAAFQKKLEARFKTVAIMNQALKTSVKTFTEIMPPTTAEAKAAGNWGLWNEWRAHNDDMWADAMANYSKWFNELSPSSRFSISGTQVSVPFNGIDWAKLTPAFRSTIGYRGRYQDLQRLNFASPGEFRPMSWVGYGGKGLAAHHQVWENFLGGNAGCGIFFWLCMRNPDLTWNQSSTAYKTIFDVLRHGLARQYLLAKRDFSPVAVLWSPNSQRAAYMLSKDFAKDEKDVMESLYTAGFQPYFISEQQILAGELQAKGTKALFLPMTISLGVGDNPGGLKVWPKIKELLDQQGVVVVTALPDRDEFLQPLTPPAELSTKAIKLASIKNDLRGELAKRGVKPLVEITSKDGTALETLKTYVHELRTGEKSRGYIVSFLMPPQDLKQIIGSDGVVQFNASTAVANKTIQCLADCSALKYVAAYEQSTGLRIPNGATIPVTITPAEGKLITLLPYAVKDVTAEVKIFGRNVLMSWQINREAGNGGENDPFLPHVIRLDVINAKTGIANPDLGQNITSGSNGQGEVKIPLSLSEAKNEWAILITDILTGKQVKISCK